MKNLIFFLVILVAGIGFSPGLSAQSNPTVLEFPFAAQALTNGDTAYMTSPVIHGLYNYSFQVAYTELSGAATVVGLIQSSNDGISWTTSSTADTLSVTDDGSILLTGVTYEKYIRFETVQTGTATGSAVGTLVLKK